MHVAFLDVSVQFSLGIGIFEKGRIRCFLGLLLVRVDVVESTEMKQEISKRPWVGPNG